MRQLQAGVNHSGNALPQEPQLALKPIPTRMFVQRNEENKAARELTNALIFHHGDTEDTEVVVV